MEGLQLSIPPAQQQDLLAASSLLLPCATGSDEVLAFFVANLLPLFRVLTCPLDNYEYSTPREKRKTQHAKQRPESSRIGGRSPSTKRPDICSFSPPTQPETPQVPPLKEISPCAAAAERTQKKFASTNPDRFRSDEANNFPESGRGPRRETNPLRRTRAGATSPVLGGEGTTCAGRPSGMPIAARESSSMALGARATPYPNGW